MDSKDLVGTSSRHDPRFPLPLLFLFEAILLALPSISIFSNLRFLLFHTLAFWAAPVIWKRRILSNADSNHPFLLFSLPSFLPSFLLFFLSSSPSPYPPALSFSFSSIHFRSLKMRDKWKKKRQRRLKRKRRKMRQRSKVSRRPFLPLLQQFFSLFPALLPPSSLFPSILPPLLPHPMFHFLIFCSFDTGPEAHEMWMLGTWNQK